MTARFEHLVVDTTPLLRGTVQPGLADHLYTVPQVIDELKDRKTRERLQAGFLDIKVMEPSAEAFHLVLQAAKKTGDYASLSMPDLKLVALMVTLSMNLVTPPRDYIIKDVADATEPRDKKPAKPARGPSDESLADGKWITPENIDSLDLHAKADGCAATQDKVQLACISGDCALQNLLLSLRLQVYTAELQILKHVKRFLLRCHACLATTMDTTLRFCDACGSPCLLRCTYTLEEGGVKRVWLKAGFEYNLRGTKYSLPKPQGGRHGDLVLRADQKEYLRAVARQKCVARKLGAAAGQDELDDRLAAVFGDMQLKQGGKPDQRVGCSVIGHGRRNPNQSRSRG